MLLAAKAQVSHPLAGGPPELTAAVDGCHVEVVRLLVQGNAELFSGEKGQRGVDYIFEAVERRRSKRRCYQIQLDAIYIYTFGPRTWHFLEDWRKTWFRKKKKAGFRVQPRKSWTGPWIKISKIFEAFKIGNESAMKLIFMKRRIKAEQQTTDTTAASDA